MSEINTGDLEEDELDEELTEDAGTADDGGDTEGGEDAGSEGDPDESPDLPASDAPDSEAEEEEAEEATETPEEESPEEEATGSVAAAVATPREDLEGQILDDAAALVGGILSDIDPDYTDKMKAYRSDALAFVQKNKPAMVGMAWKTLHGIISVRARGGFTEEEREAAYKDLSIEQLNQIQEQNVAIIGGWSDERVRQLAIYEKAKAQLSEKASNLLLKGLTLLIA